MVLCMGTAPAQTWGVALRVTTLGLVSALLFSSFLLTPVSAQPQAVAAFFGADGDAYVLEASGNVRYLSALPTNSFNG